MTFIDFSEYGYDLCAADEDHTFGVILIKLFFESGAILSTTRQKEDLVDDDQLLIDYAKLRKLHFYMERVERYHGSCGINNEGMLDTIHTIIHKFYTLIKDYDEFSSELIEKYKILLELEEEQRKQKEEEDARKEEERKKVEEEERKEKERIRKEQEKQEEEEIRLRDVDRAKRIMKVYRKEQKSGKNLHILYDEDEWEEAVEDAQETLSKDRRIKAKRKREEKKNESYV